MSNRTLSLINALGMILVALGIALPLLSMDAASGPYRYIFAAGALATLLSRIFMRHGDEPLRLRRLRRIEVWSALFYCAGAFFLFYEPGSMRNVIVLVLAGAVIQVYTSVMIPVQEGKAANKGEEAKLFAG